MKWCIFHSDFLVLVKEKYADETCQLGEEQNVKQEIET